MTAFLDDRFTAVLGVRTVDELRHAVVHFANGLEFDSVAATFVVDHPAAATTFDSVDQIPRGYRALYQMPEGGRLDPVMQHCRTGSLPIAWDRQTYINAGRPDKWEAQADFGLATGISVALHLPAGRHFCLGIDRARRLPEGDRLRSVVADLLLFAAYAQQPASRLLDRKPQCETSLPSLTAREREALQWTLAGKTAWETSRLLSISERTAVKHLVNAAHKLGCSSKHQAMVKALRLGMIA